MKVRYMWNELSLLDRIISWFPSKCRDYVKKWIDARSDITYVKIGSGWNVKIGSGWKTSKVMIEIGFQHSSFPSILGIKCVHGSSMHDIWRKCLNAIVKHENMRNADELCIWLDLRGV